MDIALIAIVAAFVGAYVATRHLEKITIGAIRYGVAGLMLAIGSALAAGAIG